MKISFRTIHRLMFFLLAFIQWDAVAQKTPNQELWDIYLKIMTVSDYSVEANIRADIPLIKIVPVSAVLYFKQPDKFRIDSKNIAILPRQGFGNLAGIIQDSSAYTAVFTGNEEIGQISAKIISVIPSTDTLDLILAKFWIDASRNLILKSQLTTRSNGTMQIDYFYETETPFGLPERMIFTVDLKKFKIPKAVTSKMNNSGPTSKGADKTSKKGMILISLKNYKINTGLEDVLFDQK